MSTTNTAMIILPIVLYVDPDPAMRERVTAVFNETRAFSVFTVESGEKALDLAVQHQPDVIISDQNLPGIKGTELLRALNTRGINPPFIFFAYNFIEPVKKNSMLQAVFRFKGRDDSDKSTLLKLMRLVCWVAGEQFPSPPGNGWKFQESDRCGDTPCKSNSGRRNS